MRVTGCDMAATNRVCPFYPRLRTKNCHTRDVWNRLLQQLKPLAAELVADNHAHASLSGMRRKNVDWWTQTRAE